MAFKNRINDDRISQQYLKDLQKCDPISHQREQEYFKRVRRGDRQAFDRLVSANLRFVVNIAIEYQGRGLPLPDLIAEGNTGLLEALNRFDETRGYKFIT